MTLDFQDIKRILPQRFPFLFIDKVLSLVPGERIVALKNISGNEAVFLGHFPTEAIFPGVLLTEAMAQASGILLLGTHKYPNTRMLLAHSDVRFLHPVAPGDQLSIEVETFKSSKLGAIVNGKVNVEGKLVAKGQLTLRINAKS